MRDRLITGTCGGGTVERNIAHSTQTMEPDPTRPSFEPGERVQLTGNPQRIGTVKYRGSVNGYSGEWVGVDWDNADDGKHDGTVNGVSYFTATSAKSGSFVREKNLSCGVTVLEGLVGRYKDTSSQEQQDEMYVLSASNRKVSVQLLGADKIQDKVSHFEELEGASLPFMGISSSGSSSEIAATLPNLKELDLTGNLLSTWSDIGSICEGLSSLRALNLSHNLMSHEITTLPQLKTIRVLVLNSTGINWTQVEILKTSLPGIEELHLKGNKLNTISCPSVVVDGFDSLRLLNLDDNCINDWNEIIKLSRLKSLELLYLNKNCIKRIWYPNSETAEDRPSDSNLIQRKHETFQNLRCLLIGSNSVDDVASVDSLNYFPCLTEIRLSDNPIADTSRGGIPRFVLISRLAKVETLNGSEVSRRERKDSEIRYVRLVMSKFNSHAQEIIKLHPRFRELKNFHGIEDESPTAGAAGPQKMASGLISITLKCIGPSIGEKAPLSKKLPLTTTVGKLKILCESFFKLKSIKPKLYFEEKDSPLPTLLEDDMASLIDIGVGNESTILIDEESF